MAESRPLRVAVVGAGPAGIYAAGHLLESPAGTYLEGRLVKLIEQLVEVDVLERLRQGASYHELETISRARRGARNSSTTSTTQASSHPHGR